MKNLTTYEDYMSLNENRAPGARDIQKALKSTKEKTKFIRNMQGMNAHVATESIIFSTRDFPEVGEVPSATGNYLLSSMYEMKDKESVMRKKIEYVKIGPNAKDSMGIYSRFVDDKDWERFLKDHKNQLLEPRQINPKAILDLVSIIEGFLNSEIALMFPPNSPKPPVGEGLEDQLKAKFGDVEISGISDDRLRLNFFFKRMGDGSAVPKTNLYFIVNPNGQSVEFKNPDKINPIQDTWTDIRNLVQIIKDRIAEWKEEDKQKYQDASQEAFRQER